MSDHRAFCVLKEAVPPHQQHEGITSFLFFAVFSNKPYPQPHLFSLFFSQQMNCSIWTAIKMRSHASEAQWTLPDYQHLCISKWLYRAPSCGIILSHQEMVTRYAAKYWIHRGGVVRFLHQSSGEQLLCAVLKLVKAGWIHHNLLAGCSVMTNLTFSSHKVDHTWPPSEMGCAFPMIWQRDETQYGKKSRLVVSTLSAVKPLPTYGKPMN